jgi:hypothetical protein
MLQHNTIKIWLMNTENAYIPVEPTRGRGGIPL